MFNVNDLMHAINLKMLMHIFFFTQINRIIRFASNFLPSSQRGRLSVVCDEGTPVLPGYNFSST